MSPRGTVVLASDSESRTSLIAVTNEITEDHVIAVQEAELKVMADWRQRTAESVALLVKERRLSLRGTKEER